jgi:hypothetical protein
MINGVLLTALWSARTECRRVSLFWKFRRLEADEIYVVDEPHPQLIIAGELAADATCAIDPMLRSHGRRDGDERTRCAQRKACTSSGATGNRFSGLLLVQFISSDSRACATLQNAS